MSSAFGADGHSYASPPVWGAENVNEPEESEDPGGQPVRSNVPVFVPTGSEPDEDGHAEIQLRRTDEDELALPVFTSVEMLVTCCGEDQPWVAFSAESLPDLLAATGADGIAQDVELRQLSAGGS
ncbi:SAV_915 family protein [Saccharopolyspora sp. NPDC002578]